MSFTALQLHPHLSRALIKCGYTSPTPVQNATIPKALAGADLITIAQTGTGKTAAFALPILQHLIEKPSKPPVLRALIMVPTRELALQIQDSLQSYGRHQPLRVATIYGGTDQIPQLRALRKHPDIIIATPGRLIDLMENHAFIRPEHLTHLVLDEADRMLHMGFLPDIEKIIAALPRNRQTMMFSATFPPEVEALAGKFMKNPQRIQLGNRSNPAETVYQVVYEISHQLKDSLILALLDDRSMTRVLIFTRTKTAANHLAQNLKNSKILAQRLHSSRSQEQREKALAEFKNGQIRVLVATDIVARGIDIEDVSHVINYDFPVNSEDYIHRIGRTGRAEHSGKAISLVPKSDLNLLGILEMAIGKRIPRKRLRGFDYSAKPSEGNTPVPKKTDWRKRTRTKKPKK